MKGAYRAKIPVLHLLKLGVGIASAQLHVSQNHLEDSVVDGLREVHVQLVHGSLGRSGIKETDEKLRVGILAGGVNQPGNKSLFNLAEKGTRNCYKGTSHPKM